MPTFTVAQHIDDFMKSSSNADARNKLDIPSLSTFAYVDDLSGYALIADIPPEVNAMSVISGAKTFTTAPKSTGSLTGDQLEIPNIQQVKSHVTLAAVMPLIDWQFYGATGATVKSKGSAEDDMTLAGSYAYVEDANKIQEVVFDGASFGSATNKKWFNRLHQAKPWTLVIEGSRVLDSVVGDGLFGTSTPSYASTGVYCFHNGVGGCVFTPAGFSIAGAGLITKIIGTCDGTTITLKIYNAAGLFTTASFAQVPQAGDSTFTFHVGTLPASIAGYAKLKRIRLYDRVVEI
jgi:hypothetical protein